MDSTIIAAIITGTMYALIEVVKIILDKSKKGEQIQPSQSSSEKTKKTNKTIIFFRKIKFLLIKYFDLSFHLKWKSSFLKYISLILSLYLFFSFTKSEEEPNLKQHIVTVSKYKEFLSKTRIIPPIDLEKQIDKNPIVNVTWFNAKKYCEFMKGRLFTEEEWRKYIKPKDVIWNFREWTNTDTINNCAIVCDLTSLEGNGECCSYEPKSKYNEDITFRCVFNKSFNSEDTAMKNIYLIIAFVLFIIFLAPLKIFSQDNGFEILSDGKLSALTSFGVGVDDSKHLRNWLSETVDGLEIKYPGSLQWGSVFITSGGDAVQPPRESFSIDLSKYKKLVVEMKGESGNECVKIGIKDFDDPDNGSEPKVEVTLLKEWKSYTFDIDSSFGKRPLSLSKLNKKKLYVVCEFVFPCKTNNLQTIYIKNIYYK